MAFIDIKDPVRRDEIVRDYMNTLREVQQRRENDKAQGLVRQEELQKVFKPVVQATEKSTEAITSEIKKSREIEASPPKKEWDSSSGQTAIDFYLHSSNQTELDKYYGIKKGDHGKYKMGVLDDIAVNTDSKIFIRDLDNKYVSYKGTEGLWRLIMKKKPTDYTETDLRHYKEIVEYTDVLDNPIKTQSSDKPKATVKWTKLLRTLEEDEDEEEEVEEGSGIQFLPGDIKGLLAQLSLLLAEYRAGNKSSTRNQIVAIIDRLLSTGYLTQKEYNAVCKSISC